MNDNQMQDASQLNAAAPEPTDIVSVNKKGSNDNKVGKAVFLLIMGAVLVGGLTWFAQRYAAQKKEELKQSNAPKSQVDNAAIFNPEKTGTGVAGLKLGSDGNPVPPSQKPDASPIKAPGETNPEVRPLRGADGKPMVNANGRAMGVDRNGNIIEVPAIALAGTEPDKRPLPGQTVENAGQQGQGAQTQKLPSRYGGSLFVGDSAKPSNTTAAPAGGSASGAMAEQAAQVEKIMKQLGLSGVGQNSAALPGMPSPTTSNQATPFFGQPLGATLNTPTEQARPGTVGSSLYGSATPVSLAKRFPDQNLMLPKGRQADCILTGRIVDDVPGFTSCVLAQNLYGDNGRVLLLERGSELVGEYGITNQMGSERLFVTWLRLKTPEGVEIDLSSPGSDRLGTSGLPGHLDNRWGARIGAAFLISFVKDITVAVINNQSKDNSSGGATVNVGGANAGQNTMNAGSSIAEEVIKQTLKVRPRLTINEGDRISIYVARDLDFSPVYALRTAATDSITLRPIAK